MNPAHPERNTAAALTLTQLSKRRVRRFTSGLPPVEDWALHDISLVVMRGSVLGVFDPDPGGADALLRVLTGAIPPTSGRAVVDGWMAPPVRQAVASFDKDVSVRDNLGTLARLARAPGSLDPDGLAQATRFAGVPGTERLELGELPNIALPRLAFAALLELRPDVMLCLREPLPGDPGARERAWALVNAARTRGLAVLVATSSSKGLSECETAAWIDEGRVRMIANAPEVASAYDQLQAGASRQPAAAAEPDPSPDPVSLTAVTYDAGNVCAGPYLTAKIEVRGPVRAQVGFGLRLPDRTMLWVRQSRAQVLAPSTVTACADLTGRELSEEPCKVVGELRWALDDGVKQLSTRWADGSLKPPPGRLTSTDSDPRWEMITLSDFPSHRSY